MFYLEVTNQDTNLGDSTFKGGDAGRMNWKNNLFFQDSSSTAYAILTAGAGDGLTIDLTYRSVRFQNNMYKFSSAEKIQWGKTSVGPSITGASFATFQASNAPNYPEIGSVLTTATAAQMFANPANRDYHLIATSPAIGKGAPLTKAVNAGINSVTLIVDRASYFQDGYCLSGECLNTADSIVVGNSAPVKIVAINDATNTITLASAVTWAVNAPVTLPFSGNAPDMGALEYGSSTRLPAPTNLRVTAIQ
jgi:hypothetical protein